MSKAVHDLFSCTYLVVTENPTAIRRTLVASQLLSRIIWLSKAIGRGMPCAMHQGGTIATQRLSPIRRAQSGLRDYIHHSKLAGSISCNVEVF